MNSYSDERTSTLLDFPSLAGNEESRPSFQESCRTTSTLDVIQVIDWCAALVLFLGTLPVLLLSLLWVAAVDRGSPIFLQVRIGLDGKPFRIFKIRTMSHAGHTHARFCSHGDERILPGGAFLRKTRIDELPQLLNVLAGNMSLVGPRPEQPGFVKEFTREIPRYQERHKVKPGITGLAQVSQGYVDSVDGTRIKLAFDLAFIEQRSMKLWWSIVFSTVAVIVFRHGAR